MNLKGRYDMLRQATLQLVGLSADDIDHLKAMAHHMRIPAVTNPDAAVSLLVLQTLIVTHSKADAETLADIKQQRSEAVENILLEVAGPGNWEITAERIVVAAGGAT